MDLWNLKGLYYGLELKNRYEIFDNLAVAVFSQFLQVKVVEDHDDYLKLEVIKDNQASCPVLFYLSDFSILSIDDVSINLRIDEFIKPFNRKKFVVSERCEFAELVNKKMLKRLYFILKRQFYQQHFRLERLPKVLIAEILSFLDYKSLINVFLTSFDVKRVCEYPDLWRNMYHSRYGKCEFNLKNLNWKEIYLNSKKPGK